MTELKKYEPDFFDFLEAGFIAINQADEDAAIKLFKAAEVFKPKNSLIKLGYGYLHFHKLELKQAIKIFQEVLKEEPNNEMAKTFMGIAMTFTPDQTAKGEKLLSETGKSHDKLIKQLSGTALDFVDRFIKKEPTPVQGKKK